LVGGGEGTAAGARDSQESWDASELDWFVKAREQDAGAVAALLKRDRQRLSAEAPRAGRRRAE